MKFKYKSFYNSSLGKILLVSDGEFLNGLYFENQKYYPKDSNEYVENDDLKIFQDSKKWLDSYFNGKNLSISKLKLEPVGKEFSKIVWQILCDIPYGSTLTYGEIAYIVSKKLNKKVMSAQAIGWAVGHNPISIIIPCHRVIGKNGNLTGYAGGLDKKQKLLQLEKISKPI